MKRILIINILTSSLILASPIKEDKILIDISNTFQSFMDAVKYVKELFKDKNYVLLKQTINIYEKPYINSSKIDILAAFKVLEIECEDVKSNSLYSWYKTKISPDLGHKIS